MGKATRIQKRIQKKNEIKEGKNPVISEAEKRRRKLAFGISYLMFGLFSSIVIYNLIILAYHYPEYLGIVIREEDVLPLQIVGALSGVLIGLNGYLTETKNKNLIETVKAFFGR